MTYFQRLVANTLIFISLSVMFPTMIFVKSIWMGVVASIVLSILNTFIKPILNFFSFPLTIMTLGLFSFVINAVMLQMTSAFVGEVNFGFSNFWSALLMAIVMSIVNTIVSERNLEKY